MLRKLRTDLALCNAWQRYESVCHSMLMGDEAPTHDKRAAAVQRRYALQTAH